jgi:hypothetical protein
VPAYRKTAEKPEIGLNMKGIRFLAESGSLDSVVMTALPQDRAGATG